jgi:hypothetical protein
VLETVPQEVYKGKNKERRQRYDRDKEEKDAGERFRQE